MKSISISKYKIIQFQLLPRFLKEFRIWQHLYDKHIFKCVELKCNIPENLRSISYGGENIWFLIMAQLEEILRKQTKII